MFKKNKVELDQQAISTFLSEGCVIDGNMKAPAFVRIEGQITGDVTVEEGLILGEKGLITGNIVTKEMIVYGTVKGHINCEACGLRLGFYITSGTAEQCS